MTKATLFDIQRNSFVDGPGVRTTVFFKGCPMTCRWCHNPESQKANPELLFYADKCTECGTCRSVCPHALKTCDLCGMCADLCPNDARRLCGRNYSLEEVLSEVVGDKPFYDASGGGVTCSGGECMCQIDFLSEFLKACKAEGIATAVDTAGYAPWEDFARILPDVDLFLYDVKCITESLHLAGTGVSNRLILDNLTRLSETFGGDILIRVPVVPGFNASDEEMKKIAAFVGGVRHTGVELLPYHMLGVNKYAALGRGIPAYAVPDKETMARFREMFQK